MRSKLPRKIQEMNSEEKMDYLIERIIKVDKQVNPNIFKRVISWFLSHWFLALTLWGLAYFTFTNWGMITSTYEMIQDIHQKVNQTEQVVKETRDKIENSYGATKDFLGGAIDTGRDVIDSTKNAASEWKWFIDRLFE